MLKNIIIGAGLVFCFVGEGMLKVSVLTQAGYKTLSMNPVSMNEIQKIAECIKENKENCVPGMEKALLGNTEQNLLLALSRGSVNASMLSSVFNTIIMFIQFAEQQNLTNLNNLCRKCSDFLKQNGYNSI